MKKKTALMGLSLLILSVISWSVLANGGVGIDANLFIKEKTITNLSFEGQEIKKVIDYLRANGWEDVANNIQKFLDAGRIKIADLELGTNGEIDLKGNIIVDDGKFPIPPKSGGFNPNNPVHVGWMMSLASLLAHEKYHAENHGWWEMIAGNGKHALGGDNDMEIEGWSVELNLLDDHILLLLDRYREDTNLTTEERLQLLRIINAIYNEKISLVDDFNNPDSNLATDDSYGRGIWNSSQLELFREHIRRLIKEEDAKRTLEEVQEHIDDLKEFEVNTDIRLAAAVEGFDHAWPQEYALRIVNIAATVAGLSPEDSFTLDLMLILDFPTDISDEAAEFLLEYDGDNQLVEVSPIEEGAAVDAHYTMIIAESTVAQIIAQEDRAAKARELYADKAFIVSAGVDAVKMKPWAFKLERDLRQSVDWYNENSQGLAVTKLIKKLFGNERINIIFTKGGESSTYGVLLRKGLIESFSRGEVTKPTMKVTIGHDVIENIRASPDPAEAVVQALHKNKIKYELGKKKTSPKNIITNGLVRLVNVIKRSQYDIRPGQEKSIIYLGTPAKLVANPNNVKVVVIRGARDLPVVDRAGTSLGYTNQFSQNIIKLYPKTFSPNAGVYLSPGIEALGRQNIAGYTVYWRNNPYRPRTRLNEISSSSEAIYVGLGGVRYV